MTTTTLPLVRFDTNCSGNDRTLDYTGALCPGNWQVIFKTVDGLDYCRETQPGSLGRDYIRAWTERACIAHRLGGAVIERW